MPVKKGRDFSEMSSSRQLEYESKAQRLNSDYAEGLQKKERMMFTLNWQPPYDWSWILGFLAARAVDGVETVEALREAWR